MKTKKNTKTTCERKQAVMQHWIDVLGRELCYTSPNWHYINEVVAHLKKAADEGRKAHRRAIRSAGTPLGAGDIDKPKTERIRDGIKALLK